MSKTLHKDISETWDEFYRTYRQDIRNLLEKNDLKFTFTKKDGSTRILEATSKIPEDSLPKSKTSTSPPHILKVFDREIEEWRSIIIDSITEIEVL